MCKSGVINGFGYCYNGKLTCNRIDEPSASKALLFAPSIISGPPPVLIVKVCFNFNDHSVNNKDNSLALS